MADVAVAMPEKLPVGPIGRNGIGWWGVGTLIATEAALFSYLLFSYYYTGRDRPARMAPRQSADLKACAAQHAIAAAVESGGVDG